MGATSWGKCAQGTGYEPNPSTPHQAGTSPLECWYSGVVNQTAYGAGAVTVGQLQYTPRVIGRSGYIDRLAFEVTAAGGVGSVCRAGIYNSSQGRDLYPTSLVVDGGEVDTTSTGVKSSAVNVYLSVGVYWFVLFSGVSAPTVRASAAGGVSSLLGIATTLGTSPNNLLVLSLAYQALPASFPAGGTASGGAPRICHIRWSS